MRTALILICLLAAIGLSAFAGYDALRPASPPGPAFRIDDPERDLGTVPLGKSEIVFPITNTSSQPRQILGVREGCRPAVCFLSKDFPGRITVGPGQTIPFTYTLDVRKPGPFEAGVLLFLEDNSIRELPLIVRGVGVEPLASADFGQ